MIDEVNWRLQGATGVYCCEFARSNWKSAGRWRELRFTQRERLRRQSLS